MVEKSVWTEHKAPDGKTYYYILDYRKQYSAVKKPAGVSSWTRLRKRPVPPQRWSACPSRRHWRSSRAAEAGSFAARIAVLTAARPSSASSLTLVVSMPPIGKTGRGAAVVEAIQAASGPFECS